MKNRYLSDHQDMTFDALLAECGVSRDVYPAYDPSPYQLDYYKAIALQERGIIPPHNTQLVAVAGSGKSTSLLGALRLLPARTLSESTLVTAFAAKIVKEFKAKLEEASLGTECRGVNSLGWKILRANLFNHLVQNEGWSTDQARQVSKRVHKLLDNRKYNKIAISYFKQNPRHEQEVRIMEEQNAVAEAFKGPRAKGKPTHSGNGILIKRYRQQVNKLVGLGRMYLTTQVSKIEEIAEDYCIPLVYDECEVAAKIIRIGIKTLTSFDFIDQYFFPVLFNMMGQQGKLAYVWQFPQYKYVFVDEAQDLNRCQRTLILMCSTGTIHSVGDGHQCIMRFAGADIKSWDELGHIPNTERMKLTVCYRVKNPHVADMAREIVPMFESPDLPAYQDYEGYPKMAEIDISEVSEGDAVVCRNTAPLISTCMAFLKRGKKAVVVGRDIQSKIKKHVERFAKSYGITRSVALVEAMYEDYERLLVNIKDSDESLTEEEVRDHPKAVELDDLIECVISLAGSAKTVDQILVKIEEIFGDETDGITLMTAHRSKGLEFDHVVWLDPHLMPSRGAKTPEDLEQESNLRYVLITRAKERLSTLSSNPDHWLKDAEIAEVAEKEAA